MNVFLVQADAHSRTQGVYGSLEAAMEDIHRSVIPRRLDASLKSTNPAGFPSVSWTYQGELWLPGQAQESERRPADWLITKVAVSGA